MRRLAWLGLAGVLLVALVMAMLIAAYLVWDLPQEIGQITVNGQVLDLHGAHAGHWLLATLFVLLVLLIVTVVVPTALMLAMIVPLSLAAASLTVAALVIGLLLSPLWLLIWWLWKRSTKPRTMAA